MFLLKFNLIYNLFDSKLKTINVNSNFSKIKIIKSTTSPGDTRQVQGSGDLWHEKGSGFEVH